MSDFEDCISAWLIILLVILMGGMGLFLVLTAIDQVGLVRLIIWLGTILGVIFVPPFLCYLWKQLN